MNELNLDINHTAFNPLYKNPPTVQSGMIHCAWNYYNNGANPIVKSILNINTVQTESINNGLPTTYLNNGLLTKEIMQTDIANAIIEGNYLSFNLKIQNNQKAIITGFKFRPTSQDIIRVFNFYTSLTGWGIGQEIFVGGYQSNLGHQLIDVTLAVPIEVIGGMEMRLYFFNTGMVFNSHQAVGVSNTNSNEYGMEFKGYLK